MVCRVEAVEAGSPVGELLPKLSEGMAACAQEREGRWIEVRPSEGNVECGIVRS